MEETSIKKTYNLESKRILIAEDEEMNFLYLEEALRDTKAIIVWCKNGQEAVQKIISSDQKFDLILMDIKMPKMNGYEATELIKKHNKELPIIIQTAFAMPEERKKGFDSGCNEYLEKPIRQKKLLLTIDKYLTH